MKNTQKQNTKIKPADMRTLNFELKQQQQKYTKKTQDTKSTRHKKHSNTL